MTDNNDLASPKAQAPQVTHILRRLFIWAAVFGALCWGAYISRGDHFHKQTDQFYYLSIADSLHATGELKVLIDQPSTKPATATSGAAFLMWPLAHLPMEKIFLFVSLFYLFLHLSTVYPLFKLLRHLGLDECASFQVLSVYFMSFAVTMFKFWPMNEGPSIFLVSWFLYFIFVRPKGFFYLICALVAPFFRAHIFIFEAALLIYSIVRKQMAIFKRSLVSLSASLGGIAVFRHYFPFETRGIGQHLAEENPLKYLGMGISKAVTHMFVPETITMTVFHNHAEIGAAVIGAFLLVFAIISYVKNLNARENPEAQVFSSIVFIVSLISLCLSLTIVARFLAPVYLWMVMALLTFTLRWRPKLGLLLHQAFLVVNIVILLAFAVTKSTDPDYAAMEIVRKLSPHAQGHSVVYFDESIPLNNRQLYGFFRKPALPLAKSKFIGKFAILLSARNSELQSNLEKLKNCQKQWYKDGDIVLANVQCPLSFF